MWVRIVTHVFGSMTDHMLYWNLDTVVNNTRLLPVPCLKRSCSYHTQLHWVRWRILWHWPLPSQRLWLLLLLFLLPLLVLWWWFVVVILHPMHWMLDHLIHWCIYDKMANNSAIYIDIIHTPTHITSNNKTQTTYAHKHGEVTLRSQSYHQSPSPPNTHVHTGNSLYRKIKENEQK